MPPTVQVFLQSYGIVVLEVAGAVNQSDVSYRRCREQRLPFLFLFIKLLKILAPEFIPLRGIVMEPLSQGATWRYVLRPLVQASEGLLHPARPQSFHQDAIAITWRCRLVDSLELNHAYLCPEFSYTFLALDCGHDFGSASLELLSTRMTPVLTVNRRVNWQQHCSHSQK